MNENRIEKYRKEIKYIKDNYKVNKSDDAIAREIELFMEAICFYDYEFDKHITAVCDVVINSDKIEEDGLTPRARSIMGVPMLRVL